MCGLFLLGVGKKIRTRKLECLIRTTRKQAVIVMII